MSDSQGQRDTWTVNTNTLFPCNTQMMCLGKIFSGRIFCFKSLAMEGTLLEV